jgi:hypothetical protein
VAFAAEYATTAFAPSITSASAFTAAAAAARGAAMARRRAANLVDVQHRRSCIGEEREE